jgi:hypothetical protein
MGFLGSVATKAFDRLMRKSSSDVSSDALGGPCLSGRRDSFKRIEQLDPIRRSPASACVPTGTRSESAVQQSLRVIVTLCYIV